MRKLSLCFRQNMKINGGIEGSKNPENISPKKDNGVKDYISQSSVPSL